jgi:Holliday junction DNA helicase RuvA
MIIGIEGEVVHKEPTVVHIKAGGLTYEVFVSLHTSGAIRERNAALHTTRIVREDSDVLYGFIDRNEKRMFDTLIKINGVGPKVAMAICSTFSPETFAKAVNAKDVAMLKKVPGIGPKAASRILVELADFIVDDGAQGGSHAAASEEAVMALESLGFKKEAILKALSGATGDTAELVKHALKKLQRL